MNITYVKLLCIVMGLAFGGCKRLASEINETERIPILRFDVALYQWIESDNPLALNDLKTNYPRMLDLLGKALFRIAPADTDVLYDNMINYFSEPTLKKLYHEAIVCFSDDKAMQISNDLSHSFIRLKHLFPAMPMPAVYLHVSGLQQNIIVADSLLSCSIDKYMGSDYPLYADYFNDYQRRMMTPDRIVIDCLTAWIKSEFPFNGKHNVLLDRMIYEGKVAYLLTQTGKDYTYPRIMSLTKDEQTWLKERESALWTAIIERKHLYTPDAATTAKYFLPMPSRFISDDAPGNIGAFIGYRIVRAYMKRANVACEDLMKIEDAQDILTKSKYKP